MAPAAVCMHGVDDLAPAAVCMHGVDDLAPAVVCMHGVDDLAPAAVCMHGVPNRVKLPFQISLSEKNTYLNLSKPDLTWH